MGIIDKLTGRRKATEKQTVTEEEILQALKVIQDPDFRKDIVSLGFVRNIQIEEDRVALTINLTTPACPVKAQFKSQVEQELLKLSGISQVTVHMTADTPKARQQPEMQTSLQRVRNIIAVASGKGGVGKSTTAVNLAFAIQKLGAKVGLLDADIYGPSIPTMTGVEDPNEMIENLVIPPQINGMPIISISMFTADNKAQILRGPMAANVIRQFLTQIYWGELDYLIIDYPPGTGDIQLTISQSISLAGAVVVTTPQELALVDVRKAISMFETMKVPVLGVVETMSWFTCDGCEKKHYLFGKGGGERVCHEFGIPLLGQIPLQTDVVSQCDEGNPTVLTSPDNIVAKAYEETASNAVRQLSILQNKNNDELESFTLQWR